MLTKLEEKVEKLLKGMIESLGYELYDVEYVKEGKNYFLIFYIDKPEGIDLNDCEMVNDAISDRLDEANYIKEPYFLEVSSPGVERVLRKDKHLEQNRGEEIEIKLFKKDENGKKEYQGILKNFDEDKIILEQIKQGKEEPNQVQNVEIERKDIAHIKTIYHW